MATKFLLQATLLLIAVYSSRGQTTSDCGAVGDVRLAGGSNSREGRVEVCLDGEWGTVCDDLWNQEDAAVVCRQLGFSPNGAVAVPRAYFGPGNGTIHLDNLECTGNEEALSDCPRQGLVHNCIHSEDASVICLSEDFSCSDGHIRLGGSNKTNEGRVEICFNNRYGTVCDDDWDNIDAGVVCNQLGFEREGAIAVDRSQLFGSGFGTIYFDNVACAGNETNLTECQHLGVGTSNCFHSEDAGVICRVPGGSKQCTDGDIRLVNGRTPSEGRVEVCYNDHWGTVCDDFWDNEDAQVVCRELGFTSSLNESFGLVGAAFGPGEGLIFFDSVECRGNESSLLDCDSDPLAVHNCGHSEDAAVFCKTSEIMCEEGSIRLADGLDGRKYEGRLEICINNHWGTVCDDEYNINEANVVCRQLGFTNGDPLPLPRAFFGEGVGVVWLDNLECTGTESSLLDCRHNGVGESNCRHSEDVSIICPLPPGEPKVCENGEIRLVGGMVPSEGRVEICFNGRWGTVCDDGWDLNDAAVVCNQLGYSTATPNNSLAAVQGLFGAGEGPILLDSVNCVGTEESILACDIEELGLNNCNHNEDAGVICPGTATQRLCNDGDVRLVGGASSREGRVEMCFNSRWGSVCSTGFDRRDAQVTCRNLGFENTRSVPVLSGEFGELGDIIFIRGLSCQGTEGSFLECPRTAIALRTSCGFFLNTAAAVVCTDEPCTEGDLRLVGGDGGNNGGLEVCVGGVWGAVCAQGFTDTLTSQACVSLGQEGTGVSVVSGQFFGASSRTSFALTSSGQYQNTPCGQEGTVGLFCQARGVTKVCQSGDVRLAGGDESRGRVEVCFNNAWGTVCDDSWDDNAAAVVCKQLGLPSDEAEAMFFGGAEGLSILVDDVKCTGVESSLFDCSRTNLGPHNCQHNEDAGVVCKGKQPQPATSNSVAISVPIVLVIVVLLAAITVVAGLVIYMRHRAKSQQRHHSDITPIVEAEDGLPVDNGHNEPKKFNLEEKL